MSFASVSSLLLESDGVPDGTPCITGHFDGDQILVPLLTSEVPAVTDQLRIAASLARPTDASLHVISPITLPDQTSLEQRRDVTIDDEQALLEWAVEQVSPSTPEVEKRFLYTRGLIDGILYTVSANDVDTLVLPNDSSNGRFRRSLSERLAHRAECDVITVNGRKGYDQVPSILLAIAGGPHSGLAADVAQRIASDCDAWIDVLHVVDEDASDHEREKAQAYVDAAYQRIARPELTSTWVLEARDVAEAIIEQSSYYGLTVIGAPTKGRLRQFISGSTNETIRNNARSVVLSTWNDRGKNALDIE